MRAVPSLWAALATACALAPANALAQAVPDLRDLVTQSEQLNSTAAEAARPPAGPGGEAGTIDGEAGIFVLVQNDIFQVSASGGLGYSSNPARTSDDIGGSGFSDLALSAGVATRLGGRVDFSASANASAREYFQDFAPSSQAVSVSATAGAFVAAPLYGSVTTFGGYSFDDSFQRSTGFYGVSANLSALLPVTPRLTVRPGVGVTRQWAEVSENDNIQVAASLDVIYVLAPRLTASVRGTIARRWYDDFYEDVTFVERVDTLYGVAGALVWQFSRDVALAASISYETQESRFFLAEFEALEGTAQIGLRARF
jgi:hypothetical protein